MQCTDVAHDRLHLPQLIQKSFHLGSVHVPHIPASGERDRKSVGERAKGESPKKMRGGAAEIARGGEGDQKEVMEVMWRDQNGG